MFVDTKFGHLWSSGTGTRCACGLIYHGKEAYDSSMNFSNEENTLDSGTLMVNVLEVMNRSELITQLNPVVITKYGGCEGENPRNDEQTKFLLLDSFQLKSSAFLSAVETAQSLSNICSILNI